MTMDEVREKIHKVIQDAVHRAGGEWKRSFASDVKQIIDIIAQFDKETMQ